MKFFASLREHVGTDSVTIDAGRVRTIHDCWQLATQSADLPDNTLCAINMQYAKLDAAVEDGAEVAFFPPVTGG